MRYLTALLAVLIVFALQSKRLNAQISVCNETWSGAIVLDSDIVVEEGCTLSIEAGTSIEGADYSISIFGTLEAIGAADNPILFNVRALNSHCGHDSFLLKHAEVNESINAGAYSNNHSYLPGLTGLLDYCRSNDIDWRTYLDTMQGAVLYENEAAELGVYDENFNDQEHQGWTSYNKWNCSTYPTSYPTLNSSNGYLNAFAGVNCSGCGGFIGTVSPEIHLENAGEFAVEVSFQYSLSTSGTFSSATLEYALNGNSSYSSPWNALLTLPVNSEFSDVSVELPEFEESPESIRFRFKRNYGCTVGGASNNSTLNIEDFKFTTNYSPTTESILFKNAILDDFSSGGMTLDSVDWSGSISVASDDRIYDISNSSFEPTQSYQAGVSIQGQGNSLNLNDCLMEGGFDASLHLEDGENCNLDLLRSSIRTSNVQGLFIG